MSATPGREDSPESTKRGDKIGISWCPVHDRYETMYKGMNEENDPHRPDNDSDSPVDRLHMTPTPEARITAAITQPVRRLN